MIFGDKHKDGATETTNFFVKFLELSFMEKTSYKETKTSNQAANTSIHFKYTVYSCLESTQQSQAKSES